MSAKIKSRGPRSSTSHKHRPKGVSHDSFAKVYWPYIPLVVLAVGLMSLASAHGIISQLIKSPTRSVLAYASGLSEAELLRDTNQARADNGQKPLQINSALVKAAQAKANDMAARNYWSHNTPAGNPPWVFVTAASYDYEKIGENLAAGFSGSQTTINGWMASPEHRENMLDSEFSDVGFGYANNPNYTSSGSNAPMTIVVAFYGKPAATASALDKASSVSLAAASNDLSNTPPSATSRAQLAMAGLPFSNYASAIAVAGLSFAIIIWISRHALALRRAIIQGETFVMSHPIFDLGIVLIGFAFFTLTRTAGFIH